MWSFHKVKLFLSSLVITIHILTCIIQIYYSLHLVLLWILLLQYTEEQVKILCRKQGGRSWKFLFGPKKSPKNQENSFSRGCRHPGLGKGHSQGLAQKLCPQSVRKPLIAISMDTMQSYNGGNSQPSVLLLGAVTAIICMKQDQERNLTQQYQEPLQWLETVCT